MTPRVRPAAVSGTFYPREPEELARLVDRLLADARAARGPVDGRPIKGIVAPHAGYVYSGPVAAVAYDRLRDDAARVRRVVLLGPAHRVYVRGLALSGADSLETPLGIIAVDADAVRALTGLSQVVTSPAAHAREHSLEVHLPFLQRVFGPGLTVVPLLVGEAGAADVSEVLARLWGGDETRVVISSDLSHYLPYGEAARVDRATVARILALEPVEGDQACGARPLNGLLALARARGLTLELVDLRSSGDTAGPRDEVVGYGSFLVHEPVRGGAA